ncbi:MAG TPA: ABC transporter permease [Candidatus Limnocylindria bacterium]|nr:ABC transporter permease [Candidatus Limnocylindria bacterium]
MSERAMRAGGRLKAFTKSKLFWALVAEALILLVGFILRPDFLSIQLRTLADGSRVLYGTPVDILNRSAEITIIALGMTMAIALGGTDISVGALVAVSGAIALKFLRWDVLVYTTPGDYTVQPFIWVIVVPLVACTLMGLFNGTLIGKLRIQPIIATLILMVAGRGIAQIVTNGKQFTTQYTPFKFIAGGSILGVPLPIVITVVVAAAVMLFVRQTSFGMFVEAVGINPSASRVSGLKSGTIIMLAYTLTGLLSGISGLIYSSRIISNDSNNAGLGYEMDAILAVVIGGTSMTGGKFSLTGTVIGSLVIRTITTLVLYFGVVSEAIMAFKALIIAVVIVLQSEPVRNALARRRVTRRRMLGGEARA